MKKLYIEMNIFFVFFYIFFWSCKSRYVIYIRSLFKGIGNILWCLFKGLILYFGEKVEFI